MAGQRTGLVNVGPARPRSANDPKGERLCRDHCSLPSQPLSRNIG